MGKFKWAVAVLLSFVMALTIFPLSNGITFAVEEDQVAGQAEEQQEQQQDEFVQDGISEEAVGDTLSDESVEPAEETSTDEGFEEDDESRTITESSEDEQSVELEKQIDVETLTADGRKFAISITFDESAGIPEGSTLQVTEIRKDTNKYRNYVNESAEALEQLSGDSFSFARFFDIEIKDPNGRKIEPKTDVAVKVELTDAPKVKTDEVEVVHFKKSGTEVMDAETNADSDVSFETDSFSVYGVIALDPPQGVVGLDGHVATFNHDGRYVTSSVEWNSPFKLRKTPNEGQAARWHFEFTREFSGYQLYHIYTMVNGEKQYLHMWPASWNDNDGAHTTLQTPANPDAANQGCPQEFAVIQNNDGSYSIFNNINGRWFYLNEWGGYWGAGFAGWRDNNNDSHFRFNFTDGQPAIQPSEHYAVIVKDEGTNTYYAVQNDGSLVQVDYDETTGVARVKLDYPLTWQYISVWDGLDDDTHYTGNDYHPTWESFNLRIPTDARAYNQGTQLAEGFYYQYITPESASGLAQESTAGDHGQFKWDNGLRHENNLVYGIQWNENESRYYNTGHYIGADFANKKIKGQVNQSDAVKVYFAKIQNVPETGSNNETVTHIDIGIIAKGHLEAPLAYGTYYDENGNPILTVSPDEDVTLNLTKDIPITKKDIMDATVTAYDKSGNELDDAFYITGYSANEHTTHSAVQVRIEGSFKVANLSPYNGPIRSNDDQNRRTDRLNNQITYEVSTEKDVTFDLIYNGQQLYDSGGNPLKVSTKAPVTAQFGYWDAKNECPVVQDDFEEKYPDLFGGDDPSIYGRNNENWSKGAIIDNDSSSYMWAGDFPPYIGDSGMDFILSVDVHLDNRILATEIKKSVVDSEGNPIKPAGDIQNKFSMYYKKDASKETVAGVAGYALPPGVEEAGNTELADKQAGYETIRDNNITVTVPGGASSDGTAIYYDYDVAPGMYYVKEDTAAVPQTIKDVDGKTWVYKETRVETEYVWRADGNEDPHVVHGYSGVPEVLGEYEFDGWETANENKKPRNGFLEFDVYNVYELDKTNLEIKKKLDGYFDGGASSNITLAFEINIKDKKTGETRTEYAGLEFKKGDELTKTITIADVPKDADITVKELYSSNYSSSIGEPKFDKDKGIWTVSIDNTYGEGPHIGNGIVNRYEDGQHVKSQDVIPPVHVE